MSKPQRELPVARSCFYCRGLHSGGATRHLHTATPIQKQLTYLSDGVREHHGGETAAVGSESIAYCEEGGVPHVHTL